MPELMNFVISGKRIYIKILQKNDITNEYIEGLNDPEVNRYLVHVKNKVQNRKLVEEFVDRNIKDPHSCLFGIFHKNKNNKLIGTVRIHEISPIHFCARIGICLFKKEFWGQGIGSEAISMVSNLAFDRFGLHYLEAGIYIENKASIKAFTTSGFHHSYKVKNKYRLEEQFSDVVFLYIINTKFDLALLK